MINNNLIYKANVLITAFDRPEFLSRILHQVIEYSPAILYISIDKYDGNNEFKLQDNNTVIEICKKLKLDNTNVRLNIFKKNKGCRMAMQLGINWFFQTEEQGIIIEEDCLPNQSFFKFCSELLVRYKNQPKIMHISGSNFQLGNKRTNFSYYASTTPHIWGWATWKNAWNKYENQIDIGELERLSGYIDNTDFIDYHRRVFEKTNNGLINTWDYQWFYTIWKNRGFCLTPNENCISNLGFHPDARNTKNIESKLSKIPLQELNFPLNHPDKLVLHKKADNFYFRKHLLTKNTVFKRLTMKIKEIISR